jgi:hypothetical protein
MRRGILGLVAVVLGAAVLTPTPAAASVIAGTAFTPLPRLIADVTATPSPFYPVVLDGYRDRTTVGFTVAAATVATTARVFRADADGRCCGTPVRTEDLGPLGRHPHRRLNGLPREVLRSYPGHRRERHHGDVTGCAGRGRDGDDPAYGLALEGRAGVRGGHRRTEDRDRR